MEKPVILICDDNIAIHQSIGLYLQQAGMSYVSVYDGQAALDVIKSGKPPISLLILDIMMPKLSGMEVCREIRRYSDLPIIILSGRVDESDRIVGLELGADDYVTKPFSPKEVATRVKAVLRRTQAMRPERTKVRYLGTLMISRSAYEVTMNGRPLKMTPREVELLDYLVARVDEVVPREDILDAVWGKDYYGDVRAVDTLIARIRSKIPEKDSNVTFRSVYGVGYMITERKEGHKHYE